MILNATRAKSDRKEQIDAVLASLAVLKTGPAHFQSQRAPALEADQGHRVILHIKRTLRIDLALPPIHLAQPPRTKLGVGLRRHGYDVEFLEEMQAGVEQMHAQVGHATATGELLLREP